MTEENPDERRVIDVLQEVEPDMMIDVEPGDIVTDIVVLARVQRLDNTYDALLISATDNTGGMTQYGITCCAKLQMEDWMLNGAGDDD